MTVGIDMWMNRSLIVFADNKGGLCVSDEGLTGDRGPQLTMGDSIGYRSGNCSRSANFSPCSG